MSTYLLWANNEVVTVAGQVLGRYDTLDEAAWAHRDTWLRVAAPGRIPRPDAPLRKDEVYDAYCDYCGSGTHSIQKMQSGGLCKFCESVAPKNHTESVDIPF